MRCAALEFAVGALRAAIAHNPSPARLSTAARVAWEWGARSESVAQLQQFQAALQGNLPRPDAPFWPASPRFDALSPGAKVQEWFVAAAVEQFEKTVSFSSFFFGARSPVLQWLCSQPFATAEMERRRVLLAIKAGHRPVVPMRLRAPAPDHLNAEIWQGLVTSPVK
jgi:hypothetical protein